MASNHTAAFGLNQWAATDQVVREDFNEDNRKIEAALEGLESALDERGNLYYELGSYVGTGLFRMEYSNTLTFSRRPLIIFVMGNDGGIIMMSGTVNSGSSSPMTGGSGSSSYFNWSGNTLSWYSNSDASLQMNTEGKTYLYCAIHAHGWSFEEA